MTTASTGAPTDHPDVAGRFIVTGGFGPTGVDTEALAALVPVLDEAREHLLMARGWAEDARHEIDAWSYLAPTQAGWAARAVEASLHGANGAAELEAGLEALGERVRRAFAVYSEAEEHVASAFRPTLLKYIWALRPVPPLSHSTELWPLILKLPADALATLAEGKEIDAPLAVSAQRAVRAGAEELQHAFPYYLGMPVMVGGRLVDPRSLTPVQRVAQGLLPGLQTMVAFWSRGYAPDDVRVRRTALPPTMGGGVLPSSPALPLPGVRTPSTVPLMPVRVTEPPRTEAELLARADVLGDHGEARGAGVVEILRSTGPDGRRNWTVLLPGTKTQLPGGRNPMDNMTNLQAMAGVVSDMEIGVATAMRQAGIRPGEPVALAVHSQGALVASRLLRDPLFAAQYRVTTLLTAGGPIGGLDLPRGVSTLSLEDVDDPVVALDGLANAPAPDHLTVLMDTRGLGSGGSPHDLESYASAAEMLPQVEDRAVQAWRQQNRAVMGVDRPGAVSDSMVFEITRE